MKSKGWDWENAEHSHWLLATEDSYYLAEKWKDKGYKHVLDLGTGLGRHAIHFAKKKFDVSAIDISEYGVSHLKSWSENEGLDIHISKGDMLSLPYNSNSMDCIFAYHVISHADSKSVKDILSEMVRVLRPDGEVFLSFCSKETGAFSDSNCPKVDDNTIICQDEGPEYGVPHFYVNVDDILTLLSNFEIEKIRHTDYCYLNGKKAIETNRYYYVNAILK